MSDGFIIIDRRKNPKSKSLSNEQRFLHRTRQAVRESAKKALGKRDIDDESSQNVVIPSDGITEPQFRHDPSVGQYDIVLPGNVEWVVGDKLRKPPGTAGASGKGSGGSGGEGEDDFEFVLSYEEYLNIIFDDMELPDLVKQTERNAISFAHRRAGHSNDGVPQNLNVPKTAIAGMARRFALRAPKRREIEELEAERASLVETCTACKGTGGGSYSEPYGCTDCMASGEIPISADAYARVLEIDDRITTLRARAAAITYLDDVDRRFNNFIRTPKPVTQAVMFCLMDVSYSMGQREKEIAKKFFLLLYLFLKRRYENIEVVFVRHHDTASECDEQTFFTSREGGGTTVSSGYKLIDKIITERYPVEDWNIYLAQASDGDNNEDDNPEVARILSDTLLPAAQHFTYLEIDDPHVAAHVGMFGSMSAGPMVSNLWHVIHGLTSKFGNISAAYVTDEREVINVLRKLFQKEAA